MSTTDPLAATIKALTESLSATDLYDLHRVLSSRIVGADYPKLTLITDHQDGPNEPATHAFKCPHCQYVMDELTILDVAKRHISSGSIREQDVSTKTLSITYDGSADFEPCVYLCTDCSEPVSLPEGWVEA